MDLHNPWVFLVVGYLVTVALEAPVLLAGLSRRHSVQTRLLAGAWLTACTYPVVVVVLPPLLRETWGEIPYLLVAETFAPLAECALFTWVFGASGQWWNREGLRGYLRSQFGLFSNWSGRLVVNEWNDCRKSVNDWVKNVSGTFTILLLIYQ